ncbi:MAG: hypothetical protein IT325_09795 [Anaerolineae bacterium]|nr:hypothetical protein [Anaerolineae bacterium]
MKHAFVRPLRDWIAVRPEVSLSSVIHLPAANRQRASHAQIAHTGTVLACGPGDYPVIDKVRGRRSKVFEPMQVKPGDRVRFGEWLYPQVDSHGGPVWLIQQGDVIGVISDQRQWMISVRVICHELLRLLPDVQGLLVSQRMISSDVAELAARHPNADVAPVSSAWARVRSDGRTQAVPPSLDVRWRIPVADLYRSLDDLSEAHLIPFAQMIHAYVTGAIK